EVPSRAYDRLAVAVKLTRQEVSDAAARLGLECLPDCDLSRLFGSAHLSADFGTHGADVQPAQRRQFGGQPVSPAAGGTVQKGAHPRCHCWQILPRTQGRTVVSRTTADG